MNSQDVGQVPTISTAATFTTADWLAFSLAVMGGLNWGLIGAFSFDAMHTATKLAQPL